jgi:DNA polymerase-4
VDFAAYVEISARIKSLLREFSPILEDSGVDEAFLDISDRIERAEDIAMAIKERIKTATGLTCSVGIGPNKLLAKLASDMQKPDGLTILRKADIPGRIWPLPVRKLIGIGPRTEERLAAMGVQTIGKLANVSLAQLQGQFGPAHGLYLHEAAHGIDESPLVTEWQPKSMSREITFQHDVDESGLITQALDELAEAAVGAARAQRLRARTVTVKVRFADFETLTRQETLARPSNALKTIEQAALRCLGRIPLVKKVRLVGIRLGGLSGTQATSRHQHRPAASAKEQGSGGLNRGGNRGK